MKAPRTPEGIPYHAAILYDREHPDGVEIGHAYPSSKLEGAFYCKYCYSTHRDFWQMDPKDYSQNDVVLCGTCGHTSKKE